MPKFGPTRAGAGNGFATPRPSCAYAAVEALLAAAEDEARALTAGRDETETEELRVALGGGGTGRCRARCGARRVPSKILRNARSPRHTRAVPDALDRALIDLAACFRRPDDLQRAGDVTASHPDIADRAAALAAHARGDRLLRCVEAVLTAGRPWPGNVKPKFAIDAMVATVGQGAAFARGRMIPGCRATPP